MEGFPVEGEEGSDPEVTPPPPPPPGEEAENPQIPPHGSGARLGFLLGVNQPASSISGAKGGGQGAGLPPVACTGSSRKQALVPPQVQEQRQKSPSPISGRAAAMSASSRPDEPDKLLPTPEDAPMLPEDAAAILGSSSANQVVFPKKATTAPGSSGSSESGEIAETASKNQALHQVLQYGTGSAAAFMWPIYESLRIWYELYVAGAKPGEAKLVPCISMLDFPSLFEMSWGYDRLYPCATDEWCPYHAYLQKFYQLNCVPRDDLDAYQLCVKKEMELRTEWLTKKINVTQNEINLSNDIQSRAFQLLLSKSDQNVTATNAAKCIAKETELIIERLRRGLSVPEREEPPNQSTQIRQLASSYMSKKEPECQHVRLLINVLMVGITKEAELMCMNLGAGFLNSFDIDLNRMIRYFAVKLATSKLAEFIACADMDPVSKNHGEKKLQLAAYIESEAEKYPWNYVDDIDCGRSAEKAPKFENSEKKQLEEGTQK